MAWREIESGSVRWTDVVNPTPEEIDQIRERFGLLPTHIQDIRTSGQRPKLNATPSYLFLVLLFPVYQRATREIIPSEVDFVVTNDAVVTVHDGTLSGLSEFVALVAENEAARQRTLGVGAAGLMIACLDRLLSACYPMLDHISKDLRLIEQKMFNGAEREMVGDILISRRNITDFRRIMQAHKNTLKKWIEVIEERNLFGSIAQKSAFSQLVERTKEIWEQLESFKETIEALHATNESLISHHLNVIMKNFTTFSVIIFAMTLLAALFAIDADGQPLLHLDFGFWYILAAEALLGASLYLVFKRNRWV